MIRRLSRTGSVLALLALVACGDKKPPKTAPPDAGTSATTKESPASGTAADTASGSAAATTTGSTLGARKGEKAVKNALGNTTDAEVLAWMNRPYDAASYRVAEALGADAKLVDRVRDLTRMVAAREYADAEQAIGFLEKDFPKAGAASFGRVLLGHARMAENADFDGEDAWKVSVSQARAGLEAALKAPGNDAFEELLLASVLGMEALQSARHETWTDALARSRDAAAHVDRARAKAPALTDLGYFDGVSLVVQSVAVTRGGVTGADRTDEGVVKLTAAERAGNLVGPAASLALARAHLDRKDPRAALDRALFLRQSFPQNVANNLVLAQAYLDLGQPGDALRTCKEVLATAPDNRLVHLLRGTALLRQGQFDEADEALARFVAFPQVTNAQRGLAMTRQARVLVRRGKEKKAIEQLEATIAATDSPEAKALLARMREGKGEGEEK